MISLSINSSTTKLRTMTLSAILVILFSTNMIAVFAKSIPYRNELKMLITGVGLLFLFSVLFGNRIKTNNILISMSLMMIVILISTGYFYFISYTGVMTRQYATLQLFESVMWIAVFSWAYSIGCKDSGAINHSKYISLAIILFFILFISVRQFARQSGAYEYVSMAYYALCLVPFALLLKNSFLKWSLVVIAFLTTLLSSKRTGFIALVVGMIVYYYVKIRHDKSSRKKRILFVGLIIAAICGYILMQYYISVYDLGILDKLVSIQEDEGSGRKDIWILTIDMIRNSDFPRLLLGHGFNSVYLNSPVHLSAHNDFLEVIYDYGLIGTFIYIIVFAKIFSYYKKVKANSSDLAAAYAVSLVLFLCMSLFAHLIIYTTHFMFLCLFWGLIVGGIDKDDMMIRRNI